MADPRYERRATSVASVASERRSGPEPDDGRSGARRWPGRRAASPPPSRAGDPRGRPNGKPGGTARERTSGRAARGSERRALFTGREERRRRESGRSTGTSSSGSRPSARPLPSGRPRDLGEPEPGQARGSRGPAAARAARGPSAAPRRAAARAHRSDRVAREVGVGPAGPDRAEPRRRPAGGRPTRPSAAGRGRAASPSRPAEARMPGVAGRRGAPGAAPQAPATARRRDGDPPPRVAGGPRTTWPGVVEAAGRGGLRGRPRPRRAAAPPTGARRAARRAQRPRADRARRVPHRQLPRRGQGARGLRGAHRLGGAAPGPHGLLPGAAALEAGRRAVGRAGARRRRRRSW